MKIEGNVVVTGGAGAIGSNLVKALLQTEVERVFVLDDFRSGYRWLLPSQEKRLRVLDIDISKHFAPDWFNSVQNARFFHLAAWFANLNSIDFPHQDLTTNGHGTLAMLELAKGCRATEFVYTGAGCSVGSERTPYQMTKALGESYCRFFREHWKLRTRICRLRNSYGPGELPGKYRNAIPNWIWEALHDRPLYIHDTGDQSRDWVYVDDTVRSLIHGYGDHDVATGVQTTAARVAEMIIRMTNSKSDMLHIAGPSWQHQPPRCNSTMSHHVGLEEGLYHTIAWFHENRERIEFELSPKL